MRELIDWNFLSSSECSRKRNNPINTSRGQWMLFWFGLKWSDARFEKRNRIWKTPRSLSGWANAGRRWQGKKRLRTLTKLSNYVNYTRKSIPTTSAGPARKWEPRHPPVRPLVPSTIRATAARTSKVWTRLRLKAGGSAPWSLRSPAARCCWHQTTAKAKWRVGVIVADYANVGRRPQSPHNRPQLQGQPPQ